MLPAEDANFKRHTDGSCHYILTFLWEMCTDKKRTQNRTKKKSWSKQAWDIRSLSHKCCGKSAWHWENGMCKNPEWNRTRYILETRRLCLKEGCKHGRRRVKDVAAEVNVCQAIKDKGVWVLSLGKWGNHDLLNVISLKVLFVHNNIFNWWACLGWKAMFEHAPTFFLSTVPKKLLF